MGTSNSAPEGKSSESPIPPVSAKRAGGRGQGKRPMFDTLQVTKDLQESGFAGPQAEAVVAAFGAIVGNVATRDDFKDFTTKDDLRAIEEKMATKDDLRAIEEKMATKDDLRAIEEKMATKDELKAIRENMVTRDDLKHYATEASLIKALGEVRLEMSNGFKELYRYLWHMGMGIITVNIVMIASIFAIAKYLI